MSVETIDNFILIKYRKRSLDAPKHVKGAPKLSDWNDYQEMMFRTMLDQLNFFYPKAAVHVLTNEPNNDNIENVVWHYRPEIEANHSAKLLLYSLIDKPAMYLDTDILIAKPFSPRHLQTAHPFNIYQLSHTSRNLQTLTRMPLEHHVTKQYNCGVIWIARPSKQITEELKTIKEEYFNDKEWIERHGAWFNNDEHPVSYFVAKYGMKMKIFPRVNAFRRNLKKRDIFKMQSIHYTGVKKKELFVKEYKELCKVRVRIFS